MKALAMVNCILAFAAFSAINQQPGKIVGKLISEETSKPLANASVHVMQAGRLVVQLRTGTNGLFTVELPEGNYAIGFSFAGLADKSLSVHVSRGKVTSLTVALGKNEAKPVANELVVCDMTVSLGVKYSHEKAMVAGAVAGNYAQGDMEYSGNTEHNTEGYDAINENGFREAVSNPLSTFSVDVDRAAYSDVRRILPRIRNL